MFSVIEDGWKKPHVTSEISLSILKWLITNNPEKEKILKLHSLIKGTIDYDDIKKKLPCVKPHGTFNKYCNEENFKDFSSYIFYDIDKGDIEKQKQLLLSKFSNNIVMLGKSCGGKGIFFYVKVNPKILTKDNFLTIQNFIKDYYLKDFIIDNNAKGINRNQVIPFDEDLYYNDKVKEFDVDLKFLEDKKGTVQSINIKERRCSTLKCTFSPIDISIILEKMNNQTVIDTGEFDVLVGDFEHTKVYFPNQIVDGEKHKTFNGLVNSIVFNNPDFTLREIQSYIFYVNRFHTDNKPMKIKELLSITEIEYNRIKSTGKFFGTRKKKVTVSKQIPKGKRKGVANKTNGRIKKNHSFFLIKAAIKDLEEQYQKPTQKKVAEILKGKKGISTIKKYWQLVKENEITALTEIEISGISIDDKITPKLTDSFTEQEKSEAKNDFKIIDETEEVLLFADIYGMEEAKRMVAEYNYLKAEYYSKNTIRKYA
jgi:hypothetical protein